MITKRKFKKKRKNGLKICILGNTGEDPVKAYSWFVRTTADGMRRSGHEVIGIDWKSKTPDMMEIMLNLYKPDILFTHMTFHRQHPLGRMFQIFQDLRVKHNVIIIHTVQDAIYVPRYDGDVSFSFDIAFMGQTENLKNWSNYWKIPTFYWPYSSMYQEKMADVDPELCFDAPVFTGSHDLHPDRRDFITNLRKIMPIYIVKTNSPYNLRNKTAELSVSTSCILGLCTGYDIAGYMDVRPFQYLGAGAFMISRKFDGQEKYIPDNLYIPFYSYDDPEEVLDHYIEWESKPKEKQKMKEKAFKYMQKYNNNIIRCNEALDNIMEVL